MKQVVTKRFFSFGICLLLVLGLILPAAANQSGRLLTVQVNGDTAYAHVEYLSEVVGARVAGSAKEREARDYIVEQFKALGYEVEIQPFSYVRSGQTVHSSNVIATKPGRFDQQIIVGAHYDSVAARTKNGQVLTGAGDNASGVGVMLEAATVLADYKTQIGVKFIAFGAEETGLRGSRYYASQMSEQEVKNTIAMINLDCVGMGDFFYVYAAKDGNPGWVRDLALNIGQGLGYDLRTSPQSEYFDYGTTGDWSDHVPFKSLGIPIAYFEWMNWDVEPDGGIETAEHGMIMHTGYDNLSFIDQEKLMQTTDVVTSLVFELSRNKAAFNTKGKVMRSNRYSPVEQRKSLQQEF